MTVSASLITSLIIVLAILVLTIPIFTIARGTEVEIPFALLVISLFAIGVLSTQIAYARKRKQERGHTLSITVLIQALLLIIIDVLVFFNFSYAPQYYWYPSIVLVLSVILAVISIIQIRSRKLQVSK